MNSPKGLLVMFIVTMSLLALSPARTIEATSQINSTMTGIVRSMAGVTITTEPSTTIESSRDSEDSQVQKDVKTRAEVKSKALNIAEEVITQQAILDPNILSKDRQFTLADIWGRLLGSSDDKSNKKLEEEYIKAYSKVYGKEKDRTEVQQLPKIFVNIHEGRYTVTTKN